MMNRAKRFTALLLGLCMMLGILSACGAEESTYRAMNICLPDELVTLDPAMVTTDSEKIVVSHLYENLMRLSVNEDGSTTAVPAVAKSYQCEDDLDGTQTYTFTLRDDVFWSDGTAVTAHDFVYAWQRLADPATEAPNAAMLDMVSGYSSARKDGDMSKLKVSAPDDYTLVVKLGYQCLYFIDRICTAAATMPVQQAAVEQENWSMNRSTLATNGAYSVVDSWRDGVLTVLPRENYYDLRRLGPDALAFRFVPDVQEAERLYEAGEVDFVLGMSEETIAQQEEGWAADGYPVVNTLIINQMSDNVLPESLRLAMSMSMDRHEIAGIMGAGYYAPADGLIPHGIAATTGGEFRQVVGPLIDLAPENAEANLLAAKDLIAEQTMPDTGDVTLIYETNDKNDAVVQAILADWQEHLGLTVVAEGMDRESLQKALKKGDFTVAMITAKADRNDAACLLEDWRSSDSGNYAHIHNSAYDLLMRISKAAGSDEARDAFMGDAERLLLESGYVIPVWFRTRPWQLKNTMYGMFGDGTGVYYFHSVLERVS